MSVHGQVFHLGVRYGDRFWILVFSVPCVLDVMDTRVVELSVGHEPSTRWPPQSIVCGEHLFCRRSKYGRLSRRYKWHITDVSYNWLSFYTFIHPIRNAVEDQIVGSVLSDLMRRGSGGFFDIDVVIPHISLCGCKSKMHFSFASFVSNLLAKTNFENRDILNDVTIIWFLTSLWPIGDQARYWISCGISVFIKSLKYKVFLFKNAHLHV